MKIAIAVLLAAVAALAGMPRADAQAYPTRTVKLLIGNPPGGPSDISLRGIAQILTKMTGQPFVVENRPGADGMIAGEACAHAAPDGYTLCMADSFNIALNPTIHRHMAYSPIADLAPIILVGFLPSGFWWSQSLPANSVADVFKLTQAKPHSVNWASFGAASSSSIYVSWFANVKGLEFANIPYKSAIDAWKAVLAGESHIAIYGLRSGLAQMDPAKVKLLAVNTDRRYPDLPDVPTFKEAGIDAVMITWFGLLAPSRTPKDIIARLNADIVKGLYKDPDNRMRFLDKQGLLVYGPAGGSPAAFADFARSEVGMYAGLVRDAKLKPLD